MLFIIQRQGGRGERERPREGRLHGRRFGDPRNPEDGPLNPRNPEVPKPDNRTDDTPNEDRAAGVPGLSPIWHGRGGRDEDRKPLDHTEDPRKPEDHTGGPLDRPGEGPERERPGFRGEARRRRHESDPEDQTASLDNDERERNCSGRRHKHHRGHEDHTEDPIEREDRSERDDGQGRPQGQPEDSDEDSDEDSAERGGRRDRAPRRYGGPGRGRRGRRGD